MVRYVSRRYVRTCGATHNIILYAVANILRLHLQVSACFRVGRATFLLFLYKQPGNRTAGAVYKGLLAHVRRHVYASLVPRPHPQMGKGLVTFERFLGCAVSARHAYGIRRTVLYVVSCVLLTQHNQENARMSPDPFPFVGGVWERDYVYARPSCTPARKSFLALLSQHVRKTGKPIRTQDSKQSSDFNAYWYTAQFQLPSVYTRIGIGPYKAHDNRSELRKIRHHADSALPINPANDPSFGRAHVRVWERDYLVPRPFFAGEGKTQWPGHHCSRGIFRKISV